jgi:SIR2-like domain
VPALRNSVQRNSMTRASMPRQTVIIFGGGASKEDGAPLQKDLFTTYFDLAAAHALPPTAALINSELASFFRAFFGIETPPTKPYPTFEEALGIIELALQNAESLRGFPASSNEPHLQRLRDHLIFLICLLLERKLQTSPPLHHNALLRQLYESGELPNTTFLSFNYDILLDNALTDARNRCGYDLDYGIDFANFEFLAGDANEWDPPQRDRSLLLLKLHGSLNWLHCPTCVDLTLTPKEKGAAWILTDPANARCRRCGTLAVPLVIPPTYFKAMSNFHLRAVWRHAEKKLTHANRLVFCGYSLPDADMHVKYVLKRAEVNRGTTPDVYILNNHRGKKKSRKEDEEERYRRLFSDHNRVRFTTYSFKDLCSRGTAILDGL